MAVRIAAKSHQMNTNDCITMRGIWSSLFISWRAGAAGAIDLTPIPPNCVSVKNERKEIASGEDFVCARARADHSILLASVARPK